MALDRAAEEFFIRVRAVHIRGIEKRDAQLKRAANRGERFFIITSAVKIGHAHAAQAQRGNYRTATSKFSLFHNKRFTKGNKANEVSKLGESFLNYSFVYFVSFC